MLPRGTVFLEMSLGSDGSGLVGTVHILGPWGPGLLSLAFLICWEKLGSHCDLEEWQEALMGLKSVRPLPQFLALFPLWILCPAS